MVGLVGEYCCRGQSFSLFVDARLILSTDNTVDRPGARRQFPQPRFARIISDTRNELAFANMTVIAYNQRNQEARADFCRYAISALLKTAIAYRQNSALLHLGIM